MASIVDRPKKDGTVTYQVKWRQGGSWQTENFGDEDGAKQFKGLVEAHGNQWPYGWIRGQGFVEEPAAPGDMPLVEWALKYIEDLTGIEENTRDGYEGEIRRHLSLIRHTDPHGVTRDATICNINAADIRNWVRTEEQGKPHPSDPDKWARRPASPKSISSRHGLLYSIVQAAIDATPRLREVNCCAKTRLPRTDNGIVEEMTFLERDEYARVALEIVDPRARDLADWLVGTGMRWGEATALQVRDLKLDAATPTASVQRAWKRTKRGSPKPFALGPPKSKKSRRRVALSPTQVVACRRLVTGKGPEDWVFQTPTGKSWRHPNFFERCWRPAVTAAVAKGLPKRPRIHDLRHSHVAWLIGAGVPLPAIQARLGHESITTTIDRYGHLVRSLDEEIAAAVEVAMSVPSPRAGLRSVESA